MGRYINGGASRLFGEKKTQMYIAVILGPRPKQQNTAQEKGGGKHALVLI